MDEYAVPAVNQADRFQPWTPPRRETLIRSYEHSEDFIKDSGALTSYGYEVVYMMPWRRRPGRWRFFLLGALIAFLFPPRPEIIVTYSRWKV